MKILITSYRAYPIIGGIENYVTFLTKALYEKGEDVTLLTTTSADTQAKIDYTSKLRGIDLPIIRVPCHEIRRKWGSLVQIAPLFLKYIDDSYDVVHFSGLGSIALSSLLAAKKADVPHIITPFFHPPDTPVEEMDLFQKGLYYLNKRLPVEKSDAVVATCELDKKALLEYFRIKNPVKIIPPGVNLDFFEIEHNDFKQKYEIDSELLVLYVGHILKLSGAVDIFMAFKDICKKYDVKLVYVGVDTGLYGTIERLAEKFKVRDRIDHLGVFSPFSEDLAKAYDAADICIMVSKYESFGLTIIESLASGTPVIHSSVGAVPDVLPKECGRLVEYSNRVEIRDALDEILGSRKLRENMSRACRKHASKYDWNIVVERYLEMYSELKRCRS